MKKKIPQGPYCYDKNGLCPYWRKIKDRSEQENGFCDYLGYGDWEINEKKILSDIYVKGKPRSNRKYSGHEIGFPAGLLWDQCKECGINEDEELI